MSQLKIKYDLFRPLITFNPVPNSRTLASEFERRIKAKGAVFDLKYQTITLTSDLSEREVVDIASEVFDERLDPAENARNEYKPVHLDINQGKIQVENELNDEDVFHELFQLTVPVLKDMARSFPKDIKRFGGWSGKNKTDLVRWIISRHG